MNVYNKLLMFFSSIDFLCNYIMKLPKIKLSLILAILIISQVSGLSQSNELKEARKPQSFQAVTPEEVGFSSSRLKQLDTLFQSYINNGNLPNILAFVARHGRIVYYKGYGWSNLEQKVKLKNDDIFRIASQTKAIVTIGMMILFEKGYFSLDDPISRYIPEFRNPRVLVSSGPGDSAFVTRPASREITFRHLLSHSSGITYESPLSDKLKIPRLHSQSKVTLKDIIPLIARVPLKHDPGADWTYGLNLDVAGYLIELISGQSLDQFLKENIFDPLGMKDTYFYLPGGKADRLVELYQKRNSDNTWKKSIDSLARTFSVSGARTYFSGGAGLVGTIEDYARFCQMILNQGEFNHHRILGRKTIELMSRNQIGDSTLFESGDKFGLGFRLYTEEGTTLRGSEGSAGTLEWGGAYSTQFKIDPKEDLILLFYSNIQSSESPGYTKCTNVIYSSIIDN